MRKYFSLILAAILFACVTLSCAAQAPDKKYIVILSDWGKKYPPKEVISALAGNPELRVTFAWPGGMKLPADMDSLVKEKRAELALSFEDEPVLPLVFDTVISTPVAINFSWPEDVWDMVVRARGEFENGTGSAARGMYLRSGVFSGKLIPGLKKLGILWSNYDGGTDGVQGAWLKDGFLVIPAKKKSFSGAEECWKWINSREEQFVVLAFDDSAPLSAGLLDGLAVYLRQSASVRAVTPEIILSKFKDKVPDAGDRAVDTDLTSWTRFPLVWYELSVIRKTVEKYKNSGAAKLETLEKLREQLYRLYGFRLLERTVNNPSRENLDIFQAGISDIYATLKLPVDESIRAIPGLQKTRLFSMELSAQSLVIVNSQSARPGKNINEFAVTVTTNSVTYFVDLDTTVVRGPFIVDIYIDLNNQEGAGLTKLLPGLEGFLEVNDAWEYAIRIENDSASLYRAGRFEPVQIKQIKLQIPWELEIPRGVLRGNPLLWGYQVITAARHVKAQGYEINDFLSKDDETREKLFGVGVMQLPAVRAKVRVQGKNENE